MTSLIRIWCESRIAQSKLPRSSQLCRNTPCRSLASVWSNEDQGRHANHPGCWCISKRLLNQLGCIRLFSVVSAKLALKTKNLCKPGVSETGIVILLPSELEPG